MAKESIKSPFVVKPAAKRKYKAAWVARNSFSVAEIVSEILTDKIDCIEARIRLCISSIKRNEQERPKYLLEMAYLAREHGYNIQAKQLFLEVARRTSKYFPELVYIMNEEARLI